MYGELIDTNMTYKRPETSPRMAPMFERVVKVISKPPTRRTTMEIKMLIPWLRKRSNILANVENDVLVDLLRHCDHVQVPADTVILRQGDIGDSFYIILSGSTSVYIDPRKTDEGPIHTEEGNTDTGQDSSRPLEDKDTKQKEESEEEEQEEEEKSSGEDYEPEGLDRTTLGNFIVKFGVGRAFGELALMSEDSARNASIVADEDTDLLTINRDLFNRSLKIKQEQEYEDRRIFIENCPLFRSWNPKFRRLLEMSMRKDVFHFGSTMVRQGDPVQGLHFIVRGQAQVTVRPALHKQQYPKCFEPPASVITREFGKPDGRAKLPDLGTDVSASSDQVDTGSRYHQRKEERVKESIQRTQIRVRRKQGYAAAEKRLADQSVTVSCLDKNEVVGDVEIILGLETYSNTVVCTGNTEAFLLDVKNLERLVYKKNMATMAALTTTVKDKLCARMRSPQVGQQVSLYKHLYDKVLELKPYQPTPPPAKEATTKETRGPLRDPVGTKEQGMSQLIKLFLKDRSPLISPAVPGSLYYLAKSVQRAEQKELKAKRKADDSALSANVRLERARKYSRRKPLSRRELERMCAGEPIDYVKQYSQNKEHAIGRILNLRPANQSGRASVATTATNKTRPHTAIGAVSEAATTSTSTTTTTTTTTLDDTVTSPRPPPVPKPTRVDIEHTVGGLFDFNDLPEDANGLRFDADDIDEEVIRNVMADIGGYQQHKQNSRAKVICSMLEKKATQSVTRNLLRPKSAPTVETEVVEDEELDDDHFDWDTSEPALKTLEEKIKGFLKKYEKGPSVEQDGDVIQRRIPASVAELKRFVVEGPDDIPIPGGTVYVRQKACKYPVGISCPSHQHVRRYMIPKNAYSLATKSLAEINKVRPATTMTTARSAASSSGRPESARGVGRPTTAPVRARGGLSSASTHSAWG